MRFDGLGKKVKFGFRHAVQQVGELTVNGRAFCFGRMLPKLFEVEKLLYFIHNCLLL